jgi:hypothetical protein
VNEPAILDPFLRLPRHLVYLCVSNKSTPKDGIGHSDRV